MLTEIVNVVVVEPYALFAVMVYVAEEEKDVDVPEMVPLTQFKLKPLGRSGLTEYPLLPVPVYAISQLLL